MTSLCTSINYYLCIICSNIYIKIILYIFYLYFIYIKINCYLILFKLFYLGFRGICSFSEVTCDRKFDIPVRT